MVNLPFSCRLCRCDIKVALEIVVEVYRQAILPCSSMIHSLNKLCFWNRWIAWGQIYLSALYFHWGVGNEFVTFIHFNDYTGPWADSLLLPILLKPLSDLLRTHALFSYWVQIIINSDSALSCPRNLSTRLFNC